MRAHFVSHQGIIFRCPNCGGEITRRCSLTKHVNGGRCRILRGDVQPIVVQVADVVDPVANPMVVLENCNAFHV